MVSVAAGALRDLPYKPEGSHAHGLQVRVSAVCESRCASPIAHVGAYLLVISNVVPKICARTAFIHQHYVPP